LKGFQRVHLARGQTQTVTVPLKAESLAYWDEAGNKFVVEAEPIEIQAGASSADIRLKKTVSVVR